MQGAPGGGYPTPELSLDEHAPIPLLDIFIENHLKLFDDLVALQRGEQLAVHIHGSLRLLKRPRQLDPDIGMLRLARPIHDAAHHR